MKLFGLFYLFISFNTLSSKCFINCVYVLQFLKKVIFCFVFIDFKEEKELVSSQKCMLQEILPSIKSSSIHIASRKTTDLRRG